MKLTFTHPRDAREFQAEITTSTTGQAALDGLIKAGFLEAASGSRAYALQLQRTGKSLPVTAALAGHGVQDGDIIAVTEIGAGQR